MFMADHLSRALMKDTGPEDEVFQVFALIGWPKMREVPVQI